MHLRMMVYLIIYMNYIKITLECKHFFSLFSTMHYVNLVNLESENLAKVTLSEVNYWAKKIFKEGKSNTLIYKKA